MRILIFNWRDIRNPDAGGAEVYTHQIAKRWVEWGNAVTLFTAGFPGCAEEEVADGVRILRSGGRYTVYWKARSCYKNRLKGGFDVVIDEINTRPFFAAEFVSDAKVVALIHQLAREFWFYEMPFPLSYVGRYLLEPRWLAKYRNIPTVTVSESTRQDLVSLGFKRISLVANATNIPPMIEMPCKEEEPTMVFMGRMRKAKLPDHALSAFKKARREIPGIKLWVVGDGYLREKLEGKWSNGDSVHFFGRVSEKKKLELLRQAHAAIVPAVREGWGQVVIEANACWTPAIGYNVHGIRDSIKDGETGLLARQNTPQGLSEQIVRFFDDASLRRKLCVNAMLWAGEFDWSKSAKEFLWLLERLRQE